MKKNILLAIMITLFIGCTSSQKKDDAVSGASPEWKAETDHSAFIAGRKSKYKILVVYFSKSGGTEQIALEIAIMLDADIEKIIDKDNKGFCLAGGAAIFGTEANIAELTKDPADYELVIIGTPIWSWNISPPARTYINKNKGKFKNLAFFTNSGNTEPDKVVKKMEELAGVKGLAFTGFADKDFENPLEVQKKVYTFVDNFLE